MYPSQAVPVLSVLYQLSSKINSEFAIQGQLIIIINSVVTERESKQVSTVLGDYNFQWE